MSTRGLNRNLGVGVVAIVAGSLLALAGVVLLASGVVAGELPPIKIGFSSPLSPPGDYQSGLINLQTANLSIEMINEAGGVLGRRLQLVVGDDQGTPAAGIQVVRKLVTEDRVSAIVGVWHGSVALAQAREATRYRTPLLAHYSWPDEITAMHSDYVFRVSPYNSQIAELLIPFLQKRGYRNVAVMAENTDYGTGFSNALAESGRGVAISVTVETFPATATDLQPEILKLRRAQPPIDLLVVASVYQAAYLIPRQARELGLRADIMAGWDYPGWSPDWWKIVGRHGVGVMYPTFYSKKMKLTARGEAFRKRYVERFGAEPPIYAYFLHDEIAMVAQAIEQAGSADPEAVARTLAGLSFEGTTGEIRFERRPGPGPVYNQWMGQQLFIIQFTEENQSQDEAAIIYP